MLEFVERDGPLYILDYEHAGRVRPVPILTPGQWMEWQQAAEPIERAITEEIIKAHVVVLLNGPRGRFVVYKFSVRELHEQTEAMELLALVKVLTMTDASLTDEPLSDAQLWLLADNIQCIKQLARQSSPSIPTEPPGQLAAQVVDLGTLLSRLTDLLIGVDQRVTCLEQQDASKLPAQSSPWIPPKGGVERSYGLDPDAVYDGCKAAARALGVAPETLRRMADGGQIESTRVGPRRGRYRFSGAALIRYLNEQGGRPARR